MALFVLSGSLTPSRPVELAEKQEQSLLKMLREHISEIAGVPLLPVTWEDDSTLLAVDGSGGAVMVSLRASLSAVELFDVVSRSGRYAYMTRRDLASRSEGGASAYEARWREFSSKVPSERGPRLIIVLLRAEADVYPVLENLSGGVLVICASVHRQGSSYLLHTEPLPKLSFSTTMKSALPAPSVELSPASTRTHTPARAQEQAQPRAQEQTQSRMQEEALAKRTTRRRTSASLGRNAAEILTAPRSSHSSGSDDDDRDTPAYKSARQVQEIRRQRTEQLIWERSLPRREDGDGSRLISESAAASESSQAVNRAAERARLSPRARLEAIAARCHAPITLILADTGTTARLSAWGTLTVNHRTFTDPDRAAAYVTGREDINGWKLWRAESGKSLEDL